MMEKPTIDYTGFVVIEDIHGVDGRLRVEKGSTGTIRSYNQGFVGVIFDDGPTYVELSDCKRRFQDVPFLYTKPVGQ